MRTSDPSSRHSPGLHAVRTLVAVALVVVAAGLGPASGRAADAMPEDALAPSAATGQPARPALAGTGATDRVVIRWATTARTPRTVGARVAAMGAGGRLDALGRAAGGTASLVRPIGTDGAAGVYRLDAPLGADVAETLAAIEAIPGVASAEPDIWVTADALPNDTSAAQLWGALGAANGSPYGIDALSAWSTTRGAGVTVAVIDTGILAHPDLAGQTVAGYDFIGDAAIANDGGGRDANPSDPGDWVTSADTADVALPFEGCQVKSSSWHGSHVAGTIAAAAGNGIGIFGAAPDARIQPIRVLGKCGGYLSDIADGITWAAGGSVYGVPANPTPARVLNLSLGGSGQCPSYAATAIATARSHGAVVVIAAGNSAGDAAASSPANCPGAFVVAATQSNGTKAGFSNVGAIVDIAAPGTSILSTVNGGATVPATMTYASYQGTSMATPHVAAAAALLAAAVPSATNDEIEAAIRSGSTTFPSACAGCGAGIANVPAALAVLGALHPSPSPSPNPSASPTPSDGPSPSASPSPTAGPTEPPPGDTTPPVAVAPTATIRTGARLSGTAVPLTVRWSGADEPGGSGIGHFELARSADGGTTWTTVSSSIAGTSIAVTAPSTGAVRYRVRAVDVAANVGAWVAGAVVTPRLIQQSSTAVRWSGAWTRLSRSPYSGGSERNSRSRLASVKYAFTGRAIALVSTKASTRGKATITIDGKPAGTVDLRRATTQYRSVVWKTAFATSGRHTIRVVVAGTSGRPRVDIDAFVVLR